MTQSGGGIGDYSGIGWGPKQGVLHTHSEYVEGCFRCDLSRDEAERAGEGSNDD